MPRFPTTADQGIGSTGGGSGSAPTRISASSAAFTAGWRVGSSRNQDQKPAAQMTPTNPKTTNADRQPACSMRTAARYGAVTAPSWAAVNIAPWTRPRSPAGNQREMTRAAFGYAPASPAPNRKRTTNRDTKPNAAPVSIANIDHQTTMRARTASAP